MLLAFAGACRASEAGPGSGLAPPAGWQSLPSLATAATDAAKAEGVTVTAAEAWGDPTRGCFGTWLALRAGSRAPDKMADEIVASVAEEVTVRDVVMPPAGATGGTLSFIFERAPEYQGKLRAQLLRDGQVTLLACFWNEREPLACETACAQLIGGLE